MEKAPDSDGIIAI